MVMEVEERHRAEMRVGYGIMIACLMIIALGVIYTAMDRLQAILIPFVLSVALAYLLTPLVDLLSCRGAKAGTLRLSRGIAVLISFFVGVGLLIGVGLVLLRALTVFQERSSSYAGRIEGLLESAFTEAQRLQYASTARAACSPLTALRPSERRYGHRHVWSGGGWAPRARCATPTTAPRRRRPRWSPTSCRTSR